MLHLSKLSIKAVVIFLIAAMLMSLLVFLIDNKSLISALCGHKRKAVKSIKPTKARRVYKTEGYYTMPDSKHFSVYTPFYVQEYISRDCIKVFGRVHGGKNECLLVFNNYYLEYALFDLSYIYDKLFGIFVKTAQQVFSYSIGVVIIWQILLSQL